MTKSILTVLCFLVFSACNEQTKSSEQQGGINSGGGNTLSTSSADIEKISDLIPLAHEMAKYRLYATEFWTWAFINNSGEIIPELIQPPRESNQPSFLDAIPAAVSVFHANPSIYSVVANAEFTIKKDQPCLDSQGNPRDGSVFGLPKYKICISPFNLSKKLDYDNIFKKLMGLMMKEYGRHTGLTDDPALKFQAFTGERGTTTLREFRIAANKFIGFVETFTSAMKLLDRLIHQSPIDRVAFENTMDIIGKSGFDLVVPDSGYLFLPPESFNYIGNKHMQISSLKQYLFGDTRKLFESGQLETTVGHLHEVILSSLELSPEARNTKEYRELVDSNLLIEKIEIGNDLQLKEFYKKISVDIQSDLETLSKAKESVKKLNLRVIEYLNK